MELLSYQSLFACLEKSFPGIHANIKRLEKIGYSWQELSTPFVVIQDDMVIAHAGVLEVSAIIERKPVTVGVIHAVCTHPDFRQREYGKKVVLQAVDYCKDRYQNTLLFTDIPSFYAPLGFSPCKEHMFQLKGSLTSDRPKIQTLRLMADIEEHVAFFKEMASSSVPLSDVLSFYHVGAIAAFHALFGYPYFKDLYYAEGLDVIIAFRREGRRVQIIDIFSKKPVSFEELLACFDNDVEEISFLFSPDKIVEEAKPVAFAEEGYFMSLHPELLPQRPCMVPLFQRA